MRGENRDYIPRRQPGVQDNECDPSEGCAFKAEATKRRPHYRRYQSSGNAGDDRSSMKNDGFYPIYPGDF